MDFTPFNLCFVCFSPPQPSPWSLLTLSWFGYHVTSELLYFLHADSPPSALHSKEEGIFLCADVVSSPCYSDTLDPLSWVPVALRMSLNSTTRAPRTLQGYPPATLSLPLFTLATLNHQPLLSLHNILPTLLHFSSAHPPGLSFCLAPQSSLA